MHAMAAEELIAALHGRGMRVTPQRVVVYLALRELDRHVAADELLELVSDRLPGVSLPTIYASLELLEELGMVRRVQRAGAMTLYDPRVEPHHHLVCEECGAIEDLDSALDDDALLGAARVRGFAPARVEAIVHGRCRVCDARVAA